MLLFRQFLRGNAERTVGASQQPTAYADYPGAALLAHQGGSVLGLNSRGEALARLLKNKAVPEIARAIDEALAGLAVRVQAVGAVPPLDGDGGASTVEVTVLPQPNGESALVLGRDVTLERNLREALAESRQRYKDLVDISSDFAWETGPDGTFVFVSPRGALGWSASALVGQPASDFLVEQPGVPTDSPFRSQQPLEGCEIWFRAADGKEACLLVSCVPLYDAQGRWRGARGICRDISVERERDAALARARNREALINHITRTIRDEVEPQAMLTAAAAATARVVGAQGCSLYRIGSDGSLIIAAQFGRSNEKDDAAEIARSLIGLDEVVPLPAAGRLGLAILTRYRHQANGLIHLWRDSRDRPWTDEDRSVLSEVATQLGVALEQVSNHERILALSRTDGLTGLLNRRAFFEALPRRFRRLAQAGQKAALFYVDLDNFKLVNDAFGHRRGDEALLRVRDVLQRHTRDMDLVARLGGDEFALWLDGIGPDSAVQRGRELLGAGVELAEFSGDPSRPLGFSIGIAVYDPARPETLEEMLARADNAMYEAKRNGKGNYRIAPPAAVRPDQAPPVSGEDDDQDC